MCLFLSSKCKNPKVFVSTVSFSTRRLQKGKVEHLWSETFNSGPDSRNPNGIILTKYSLHRVDHESMRTVRFTYDLSLSVWSVFQTLLRFIHGQRCGRRSGVYGLRFPLEGLHKSEVKWRSLSCSNFTYYLLCLIRK